MTARTKCFFCAVWNAHTSPFYAPRVEGGHIMQEPVVLEGQITSLSLPVSVTLSHTLLSFPRAQCNPEEHTHRAVTAHQKTPFLFKCNGVRQAGYTNMMKNFTTIAWMSQIPYLISDKSSNRTTHQIPSISCTTSLFKDHL